MGKVVCQQRAVSNILTVKRKVNNILCTQKSYIADSWNDKSKQTKQSRHTGLLIKVKQFDLDQRDCLTLLTCT